MAILSLLMLLLLQFVIVTQRAWLLSQQRTRVYENSRAVFEVIERDFQTIAISDEPGRLIKFYIGSPSPANATDCQHCCVVSTQDAHGDAVSRLVEISYKHHIDSEEPSDWYSLRRQVVSDNDTANWDCINPSDTWYINNNSSPQLANFEVVARGVDSFSMAFYDSGGNLMTPGVHAESPTRIVVNVTLFDDTIKVESERFKTQRSFTKVFHLPSLL